MDLSNELFFKEEKNIYFPEVLALYNDAEWTAYTAAPDKLQRALANSLYLLTAWKGERLVGLLRAVGDGLTILYIQDLLVLQGFRRQGIGNELLRQTLKRFAEVRQILLLTDDQPNTITFYEKAGLQQTKSLKLLSFIRLRAK